MQSWSAPLCAALASALQAYTTLLAAATANISGSSTSANTNKAPLHTVVGTTSTGATITTVTGASDNGLGVTFSISNGTSGGNGTSGSNGVQAKAVKVNRLKQCALDHNVEYFHLLLWYVR